MSYRISFDPADFDLDLVHRWLAGSYWSPRIRKQIVAEAFANSLFVTALESETNELVGVSRLVTDYATFAWLCDVYVAEPHRGRGVGKQMIRALHDHPRLQTLRRWCLATQDAQGVYEQVGYGHVEPGRFMIRKCPPGVWQDASG